MKRGGRFESGADGPASQAGSTVFEFLTVVLLSSFVFSAAVKDFMGATRHGADNKMMLEAHQEAVNIADLMAFDLRMLGAGVPFYQGSFSMEDATVGASALPLLLSSDGSAISFRLNEKGTVAVLMAQFDPAAGLTMSLDSTAGFETGDSIYLTNSTVARSDGLAGTVVSVSGNTITLNAGYTASAGAVFPAGSLAQPVTTVTYTSPADGSGITRQGKSAATLISPRSSFSLEYRDGSGAALSLPLSSAALADNLTSIRLSVSVNSARAMQNGSVYQAQASHTIALRNLILSR